MSRPNFAALSPGEVPESIVLPAGSPGAITFGLSAVRNVGEGLVDQLLAEREANGPYAWFHEFADRVPEPVLNKRAVESLIKAGAFDSLGHPRRGLLGVFEQIMNTTLSRRREREIGVMSLFGDVDDSGGRRRLRRAAAGSRHRVRQGRAAARREGDARAVRVRPSAVRQGGGAAPQGRAQSIGDLEDLADGATVHIGGVVTGLSRRFTKRGDQMATFTLEDLEAEVEVTLFPRTLIEHGHKLAEDLIVAVSGRLDKRDEGRTASSARRSRCSPASRRAAPTLTVNDPRGAPRPDRDRPPQADPAAHPGASPVVLDLGTERVRLTDEFRVDLDRVVPEIRMAFGHGAIAL